MHPYKFPLHRFANKIKTNPEHALKLFDLNYKTKHVLEFASYGFRKDKLVDEKNDFENYRFRIDGLIDLILKRKPNENIHAIAANALHQKFYKLVKDQNLM